MELHVWGSPNNVSMFDVECLAAVKYLSLVCRPYEYIIIPSSNTDISKSGRLPALRDGDFTIDGFYNIIQYFKKKGCDLDSWMNDDQKRQNAALIRFINDKIGSITLYELFLNWHNYSYLKQYFIKTLPFPLQYNSPSFFRALAKEHCARVDLAIEKWDDITINNKVDHARIPNDRSYPNLNLKSSQPTLASDSIGLDHSLTIKSSINLGLENNGTQLKPVKHSYDQDSKRKCLTLASLYYRVIQGFLTIQLQQTKNGNETQFMFGSQMSSADVLLNAHLTAQLAQLPDHFISNLLHRNFTSMIEYYNKTERKCSIDSVPIGDINQKDIPNLWNALVNRVHWGLNALIEGDVEEM